MARFGVELVLVLFGALMTVGILITYIVSVKDDHVQPDLPYISNTGSYPPESCVFSFVLSCVAIIAFVIVWIRYRHIKLHYADSPAKVQCLNVASFIFGFMSMFGLILVGSFQDVNVIIVHLIGAFMVFISGAIYSVLQTCLSHRLRKTHPQHVGCCTLTFRIIFCVAMLISVPMTIVFSVFASNCRQWQSHRHYEGRTDKCYILHLLGSCSEWVIALSMVLYFLTFHPDFQRINVSLHISVRHHHNDIEGSRLNEATPLTL